MKLTSVKRFLITMISFAVLGAAFKVMTLVEGLTEIRPANAIPVIAGLLCGPVGALGCAAGNLIADFFGSLGWPSILGMIGNFLAAFLPWRLWYLYRSEQPNVHTYRNLALYGWLSLISALTVAWLLGFGLELFFGLWIENIYRYVFCNNFAFSLGLGLPIFIVLTSDSVQVQPSPRPGNLGARFPARPRLLKVLVIVYTLFMLLLLAGVYLGKHLKNSVAMSLLSASSALLLVCLCILPVCGEEKT